MSTTRTPTPRRREALALVSHGHVEYGAEHHPNMAGRAARRNGLVMRAFITDGCRQGPRSSTWQAIEERGWITVRHALVPTHIVPERTQAYRSLTGTAARTSPAHLVEPIDPGWRAPVELTDAGRQVLAQTPTVKCSP
jgi:hypothetical protein